MLTYDSRDIANIDDGPHPTPVQAASVLAQNVYEWQLLNCVTNTSQDYVSSSGDLENAEWYSSRSCASRVG